MRKDKKGNEEKDRREWHDHPVDMETDTILRLLTVLRLALSLSFNTQYSLVSTGSEIPPSQYTSSSDAQTPIKMYGTTLFRSQENLATDLIEEGPTRVPINPNTSPNGTTLVG